MTNRHSYRGHATCNLMVEKHLVSWKLIGSCPAVMRLIRDALNYGEGSFEKNEEKYLRGGINGFQV